uniref:hypothetical protein n=1 Tax=Ornithobacterium rhinotracheale TaxID=28251 RepID=UPI0039A6F23C
MGLYFVPISTCRYPNQIVKIRVFPDISWGITFSIGAIDPKYKEDWKRDLTEKKKKVLEEYRGAFNYASKDSDKQAEIKKKQKTLKNLNLQLGLNASLNSEEYDLTIDFGDKIRDVVYSFGLIKEIMDNVMGNGESAPDDNEKKLKYLQSAKKSKLLKGLTKLPIKIVIENPALSCGFAWNFREVSTKGVVTCSYDIFIKAAPIISASGTLDLIALAGYIPAFGQAVEVVDIVLEVSGIDADFFIRASGKIDFGTTMKIGEEDHLSEGDIGFDGDFKIRVEASLTIGGGLIGFLFMAGDWKGDKITEYRAYGETGLTGALKTGADIEGPYIDANISFSGLIFVAEKVQKDDELGAAKTDKLGPYPVIKSCKLIGGKYYFINHEKAN